MSKRRRDEEMERELLRERREIIKFFQSSGWPPSPGPGSHWVGAGVAREGPMQAG